MKLLFGSQHWFEDDTKLSRNLILVNQNCLIQINKVGIVAKGLRFWLEGKRVNFEDFGMQLGSTCRFGSSCDV